MQALIDEELLLATHLLFTTYYYLLLTAYYLYYLLLPSITTSWHLKVSVAKGPPSTVEGGGRGVERRNVDDFEDDFDVEFNPWVHA